MPDARPDSWWPWISRVIAVTVVAMLLYMTLAIWSGLDRLAAALSGFPMSSLPTLFGLVILGWALRAFRWHYYTRCLRWRVPFHASLLAFLASFALTATPGKAGEVVKAGLLRSRYGVAMADTTGVLLVERLGDLLAVLILAAGGLTIVADARLYFLICLVLVGGIILLVTSESLYRPLFSRLARFPHLKTVTDKILQMLDTGRNLLRLMPFIVGVSVALVAWACEAFVFHLILGGFGLNFPLLTSFSVYGVSTVIGALSLLPGGVGGVEAAMLLLLTALGVDPAATVAPIVLTRFSTLWLISLLGFAFMGVWWLVIERGQPDPFVKKEGLSR